MQAFVTAGAGFLLAVLWFDLMFDVQSRRGTPDDIESISTYYARVTRGASPMNRLVAVVMLATLAAEAAELAGDSVPTPVALGSLALTVLPVGIAGARTVPSAVRLGQRLDPPAERARAARQILTQHVACFACIALVLVTQLASLAS